MSMISAIVPNIGTKFKFLHINVMDHEPTLAIEMEYFTFLFISEFQTIRYSHVLHKKRSQYNCSSHSAYVLT